LARELDSGDTDGEEEQEKEDVNPEEGVFSVDIRRNDVPVDEAGVERGVEKEADNVGVLIACPCMGMLGKEGWMITCGGFCAWEWGSEAGDGEAGRKCGLGRVGKLSSPSSEMDSESERRPSSWNVGACEERMVRTLSVCGRSVS
jgi:hypothetical protein